MKELWFRARNPDEGQGYRVASPKGVVAAIGFALAAGLGLGVPLLLDRGGVVGFAIGAVLFLAAIMAFLAVVRRHSDWRG